MKKFIEEIRLNKWLSAIAAILLGLIVLLLSSGSFGAIKFIFPKVAEFNFYTSNVIFKVFMLVFSILIILLINNGTLKGYGFVKPQNMKVIRTLLISIGVLVGSFIFGNIVFNGVLRTIFAPGTIPKGFSDPNSLIEVILTVWIWSSICEEVLTRGLIQGFLNFQTKIKFLKLSLPVWISALFFGAMHLSLLKENMDVFFVSFIVFNTTVIGLLAAYYREKTGSVYVSIMIHILANIIGYLPAIIFGNL